MKFGQKKFSAKKLAKISRSTNQKNAKSRPAARHPGRLAGKISQKNGGQGFFWGGPPHSGPAAENAGPGPDGAREGSGDLPKKGSRRLIRLELAPSGPGPESPAPLGPGAEGGPAAYGFGATGQGNHTNSRAAAVRGVGQNRPPAGLLPPAGPSLALKCVRRKGQPKAGGRG